LETFFLTEEKRALRTQNFRDKNSFHDLFGRLTGISVPMRFTGPVKFLVSAW
jgi:hypothetical protein